MNGTKAVERAFRCFTCQNLKCSTAGAGRKPSTARPVLSAVLSVEQQILREFPEVAVSLITFVRD